MLEGGIFVTQKNNKIFKIPRNIKYLLNHCLMQKKKSYLLRNPFSNPDGRSSLDRMIRRPDVP